MRSHAYSGKRPNSLKVVRALEMRTARAATGGTPALLMRVVAGNFASSQAGLMRARSFWANEDIEGDFVWTYARM